MNCRACFGVAFVVIIQFSTFVNARAAEPPTEAEIEKQIIGSWYYEWPEFQGYVTKITITFNGDGTFRREKFFTNTPPGKARVIELGNWKLDGAELTEENERSIPPGVPEGSNHKFKVLAIDDKQLKLSLYGMTEETRTRVAGK
jgi:hypothetical protein